MEAIDITESFEAVFNAPVHAKAAVTALEAARQHMTVREFTGHYNRWLDLAMPVQSAS